MKRLRLKRLTPMAVRILSALWNHADRNGTVRLDLTQHELADEVGCARDYCSRALLFLEVSGAISATRKGRRTFYVVNRSVPIAIAQ